MGEFNIHEEAPIDSDKWLQSPLSSEHWLHPLQLLQFSLPPFSIYEQVHLVFPIVMHWCESWTLKKAEHWIIDAFKLWCWRRLFRVPWTTRRSNQSILKQINTEYSLEGLMRKLKLQYFGHLIWRADSLEKTLMLGKIEGKRRMGWQRMRWLDSITNSMDMNLSKLQEIVENREAWYATVHGVIKNQTHLSNWTKTTPTQTQTHTQSQINQWLIVLWHKLLEKNGQNNWLRPVFAVSGCL